MIALIENKTISNAAAKTVFEVIVDKDEKPADIVKEKGLAQISDSSALQSIVDSVIAANEKAINDYKGGRTNVLGFLVGQCMKQSKGQGNPAMFKDMMIAAIENS
jgi:aspartyl-tRNA(Asn)/glutamyl-tRNA(Gln) amidotransferase subunit B